MVMWSIDSNGTSGFASYAAKVASGARNGSIALFHYSMFAPSGFPNLIDQLRNANHLELTTVTGLFV
jgi:hypothetical protein